MPDLVSCTLPDIPAKRYFTIGEVAGLCDVKAHILRYWEQEFEQLSPVKRRGNRRYYRQEDVNTVREIKHLLYEQGFTICGARQILSSETPESIKAHEKTEASKHIDMSQFITELELLSEYLGEELL